MDIDKLRKTIDTAIAEVTKWGWKISPGMWVSKKHSQCCPLGAVAIYANAKFNNGYHYPDSIPTYIAYSCDENIPSILGCMKDEVYSFADGFDKQPYDNKRHVFALWQLGREYSDKYKYEVNDVHEDA